MLPVFVFFSLSFIFLEFCSTEIMTSSLLHLSGHQMTGKDHFTELHCTSELSVALNSWVFVFSETKYVGSQELSMNGCLCGS